MRQILGLDSLFFSRRAAAVRLWAVACVLLVASQAAAARPASTDESPARPPSPAENTPAALPADETSGEVPEETPKETPKMEEKKRIIGATASLQERKSGLLFRARVDTGAKSSSLHVEKIVIDGKSEPPSKDNIGKQIRFQIKNDKGQTHWIECAIKNTVLIKNSNGNGGGKERRYKVPLTLRWKDVNKRVLVTLNDRSRMEFPLLIGRDFLRGDFLVDVALDYTDKPNGKKNSKNTNGKTETAREPEDG